MHRIIRKPTEADLRAIEALLSPEPLEDSSIGKLCAVFIGVLAVVSAWLVISQ